MIAHEDGFKNTSKSASQKLCERKVHTSAVGGMSPNTVPGIVNQKRIQLSILGDVHRHMECSASLAGRVLPWQEQQLWRIRPRRDQVDDAVGLFKRSSTALSTTWIIMVIQT